MDQSSQRFRPIATIPHCASNCAVPFNSINLSDGYVNALVIKFNRDGEYITHWGKKGTGDGEFNLVHDVCLDSEERVCVADRINQRVQVFDKNGKFLGKWTEWNGPGSGQKKK